VTQGNDPGKAVEYLQQRRIELLRELGAGRHERAAQIGLRALSETSGKISTVPSRELASIIAVDVQVANALKESNARSAIAGITRTYELAGVSPESLKKYDSKALAKAWAGRMAGRLLLTYLIGGTATVATGGLGRTVVARRFAPATRLFAEYVGQGPLALRACMHGNQSISGRCHRPPCPAQS